MRKQKNNKSYIYNDRYRDDSIMWLWTRSGEYGFAD